MTNPVNLLVKALAKQDPLYQPVSNLDDDEPTVEPTKVEPTPMESNLAPNNGEEDLTPTELEIRELLQRQDEEPVEMVEVLEPSEPKFEVLEDQPESKSYLEQSFVKMFDSIELEVGFDPSWENGTGYLDGVVHNNGLELEVGQVAKTVDDNNRRIILVHTPLGTVAFFERYTPNLNDGSFVVVCHVPHHLKYFANMSSSVSADDLVHYVGLYGPNIGEATAELLKVASKKKVM